MKLKLVGLVSLVLIFQSVGQARSQAPIQRQGRKIAKVQVGHWGATGDSVIKYKGQNSPVDRCAKITVSVSKDKLAYQLECGDQIISDDLVLGKSETQSVYQQGEHITINHFGFIDKSPQVSRLDQAKIRVPFVDKIIYVKTNQSGSLSFYLESFRVDEFGRVVQIYRVESFDLQPLKRKVAAKSNRKF